MVDIKAMKQPKDKGEEMNAIATRVAGTPAANVQDMAMRIAREAPTLADLNHDQLEQIARMVMTQRLTQELNTAVDLAGVDWHKEKELFLDFTQSSHTRRAYTAALDRLEAWAIKKGINPLELTAAHADRFIHDMKAEGRAAASTRRDVAAVSAFYSFLERDTDGKVKNPIRGTRQRPPKENKKEIIVPSKAEYKKIIDALPPIEKAIVITLALRGLRVGALPTLELKRGKYHGTSKGKALEENDTHGITLPRQALDAIAAAGLNEKNPFAWDTRQGTKNNAAATEGRINYYISKLHQEGKIAARYSAHDFRHFYAVQEYEKNRDIFRLSKLLNHAGVQITQTYLKSLGVEL
jgi:site-specific recombinase XerD